MPRVERNAEITLVILIFRSTRWLDWCIDSIDSSKNNTRYRYCIVANDATEEVRNDHRVSVDWHNENPNDFYIKNVYQAWNEGVLNATTPWVVMLNSDMYGSDCWLDELVRMKKEQTDSVPTSLLVESGKLQSAMPEFVRNFGKNPDEFDRKGFLIHAKKIRKPLVWSTGRLYMPILVDRQEFFDVGGYPEGNPPGTTGDKDLIRRYREAGFKHLTAEGSVIYHCQLGEQEWP